jgi:mRNA interferase MazF
MVQRGDVHWADMDPRKGSEQGGNRPVLILQDNATLAIWRTVVVIPLTSNAGLAGRPGCVLIPTGAGGLRNDSVALCHQIRAVDKQGIGARLGTLPATLMTDVENELIRILSL